MSVDPKETAAFVNILGKLDGVKKGETVVDVAAGNTKRLADNDMTAILSAFASTSGTKSALTLTPEALQESTQPVDEETVDEVIRKLPDQDKYRLYSKDGKKNLGTFDSKKAAEKHEKEVQYFKHAGESIEEDSLGDIKTRLTDYLSDIKASDDKDLAPKKPREDHLGKPIKTMNINGKTVKLHGNEDDGFRLKVNDKLHSATFKNLEQALMACEAYMKRGKK